MFNEETYIAFHGNAYLKCAIDSHKNPLQVQFVLENEEDYRQFKEFKKHRKGKAGSGMYRGYYCMPDDQKKWLGHLDLRFRRWSMSSDNGAVVVFDLDYEDAWRQFRNERALDQGYRLDELKPIEFVLAELTNDGQLVNVKQRAKLEQRKLKMEWPKGGPQSVRAARLCNHTDFVNWLKRTKRLKIHDPTPAQVAEWMRNEISIDTRAQLDHDDAALIRFEEQIAKPFLRSTMDEEEWDYGSP